MLQKYKKNLKRILWTIVCHETGHPGRYTQVSRNIQSIKMNQEDTDLWIDWSVAVK